MPINEAADATTAINTPINQSARGSTIAPTIAAAGKRL